MTEIGLLAATDAIVPVEPRYPATNLGHTNVKTTQDYIGVLDGSTRAPVSVYDASVVLARMQTE